MCEQFNKELKLLSVLFQTLIGYQFAMGTFWYSVIFERRPWLFRRSTHPWK